jgi:fido (protein-threonine AMPylation protein)
MPSIPSEGNGRTQLAFLTVLAEQAGHPVALERIDPTAMLDATITSFGGSEKPLATLIPKGHRPSRAQEDRDSLRCGRTQVAWRYAAGR